MGDIVRKHRTSEAEKAWLHCFDKTPRDQPGMDPEEVAGSYDGLDRRGHRASRKPGGRVS